MGCELIDRYLLGEPVSKPAAIEAALADRSSVPAAAPFYRALEAVGPRAADEALLALRLVVAGRAPSDEAVRQLRALASLARACAMQDTAGIARLFQRDAAELSPLGLEGPSPNGDMTGLGAAARAAYAAALAS
ncbi:MAG: hypothetical protein ACLPYS_07155 [Vulcanimicrobiaceae bacterium]